MVNVTDLTDPVERAVYAILLFHVGKEKAIKLPELVKTARERGIRAESRLIRFAVQSLRKRGALICSAGGSDGGYWIAASAQELDYFFDHELRARAMDLLEQEKSMRRAACEKWGSLAYQTTLDI